LFPGEVRNNVLKRYKGYEWRLKLYTAHKQFIQMFVKLLLKRVYEFPKVKFIEQS